MVRDDGEPATSYERPTGVDDATVEAVGRLGEAIEWLERARGRLYDFHQMMGHLDLLMGDAAEQLRKAGHKAEGDRVDAEVVGRNVIDGRWTFQLVDEFELVYCEPVRAVERQLRDALMDGRRHVFEAEMKQRRRSPGLAGHDERPAAAHDPRIATVDGAD